MKNEKFTITVSSGMQIASVEQIDNTVVVLVDGAKTEPEKADFKDGDIIYQWVSDVNKSMLIILRNDYTFKEGEDNIPSYAIVNLKGDLTINEIFGTFDVTEFRLATENEKTILFDALAKDGKQWDLEKKCIEPLKWQPKEGDEVYLASFHSKLKFEVLPFVWDKFKTLTAFDRETQVECQQLCDKLNAALYEK